MRHCACTMIEKPIIRIMGLLLELYRKIIAVCWEIRLILEIIMLIR